ncbi:choice-of-anchor D domain-containing protein [Granulicella arctica]|uniref:choice-of-anchor D domain-containing protein n=1 Tax=Granulicella arctica TaxID=940613 RepID=UPI0021DF5869|nr:choice-of-anchor D domain-containing protein [Granulicella arctica]
MLRLLPGSVDFGDVALGEVVKSNVAVVNDSATPLVIGQVSLDAAGFSLMGDEALPIAIAPHATHTLVVGFQPSTSVDYAGQLTVLDTLARPMAQIAVSGSGRHSRRLSLSSTSLTFPGVNVNSTSVQTLTLTASESSSVTINSITALGSSFSLVPISFPVTLNPSQSLSLRVKFIPVAATNFTGSITIESNSFHSTATVSLSGSGILAPQALSPALGVSATTLNFGTESLNVAGTQALTLTSVGSSALTINSESLTGSGFTASGTIFPITLQPSQSQTLNVTFKPSAAGAVTGQLAITSNSVNGNTTLVSLAGTGAASQNPVLGVSASSLNFGSLAVGSSSTQALTMTSTGSSALTVTSSTASGADFALIGGSFPITLAPSQSAVLQLRFTPASSGSATGTLSIASNSTTGSTTSIGLSGVGTAVAHEADLSWTAPSTSADPVEGYNVYRISSTGDTTLLNSSPNVSTSYVDHSVQSGSQYQYIVKSVDANGTESVASNEFLALIP